MFAVQQRQEMFIQQMHSENNQLKNDLQVRSEQIEQLQTMVQQLLATQNAQAQEHATVVREVGGGVGSDHRMVPQETGASGTQGMSLGSLFDTPDSRKKHQEDAWFGGPEFGEPREAEARQFSRPEPRAPQATERRETEAMPPPPVPPATSLPGGSDKQKRKEADSVRVPQLPKAPGFRAWKMALRDEIAGASGSPQEAFAWILKVEKPGITSEELGDSENFPSLDAKLAAALSRIASGGAKP